MRGDRGKDFGGPCPRDDVVYLGDDDRGMALFAATFGGDEQPGLAPERIPALQGTILLGSFLSAGASKIWAT